MTGLSNHLPMDGNRRVKALTDGLPMGERHGLGVMEQNEEGSGALGLEGALVLVGPSVTSAPILSVSWSA